MANVNNEHTPTAEMRERVAFLSVNGIGQGRISEILGIAEKTLRKHYRDELDNSLDNKNSQVAQSLFKKALEGDTGAMCFWLKTRAGWKETVRNENVEVPSINLHERDAGSDE